jgi:hypothetical protein
VVALFLVAAARIVVGATKCAFQGVDVAGASTPVGEIGTYNPFTLIPHSSASSHIDV